MRIVLREEKKFLINHQDSCQLEHNLSQVLICDPHNTKGGYMVRSLYFDTIDNKDFLDKMEGVSKRRKIRLRIYDPTDQVAYLEMKQKDGKYQTKRSLELTKEDALKLIDKDYDILLKYENPFATECYAFMKENLYVPKTIVEYQRNAYIAKENNIRITFDRNIRSTESNFNIFDKNLLLYPVFPKDNVVLEVKYNGFLLSYVKNLVNHCNKSELSVSKYCLARSVSLSYVY